MATDDTTACSTRINEELSMSFTTETIYFVFNKLLNVLLMDLKLIFLLQASNTRGAEE